MPVPPEPHELLQLAVDAARQAGALLLDGQHKVRHIQTKSSATDMVSEMDRASETLIRSVVAAARPDDAVLGEEEGWGDDSAADGGGDTNGDSTRADGTAAPVEWIVDPLDGTTNFLYGFPAWAVSIAARVQGTVAAGAVFDPIHDEMWTAIRGGGASRNAVALPRLVDRGDLATALVATGFSYQADRRVEQGRVAGALLPRVRDLRRAGAAALDLCWVAAGRVDAYFEQGTHIWDWAAGALVATEVGASVSDFEDGPPSEAGLLAARPQLAAELRAAIRT